MSVVTGALRVLRAATGSLRRCPVCAHEPAGSHGACRGCEERLAAAIAALPPPTGPVVWLGAYAGPWLRLVHGLKFDGDRRLATLLGRLLALRLERAAFEPHLVVHVPASPARLRERGFDQAELLAAALATGLTASARSLLSRSTSSLSQASLSRAQRTLNAGASFDARACPGRKVLLVDDVLTTGSTAAACTAALIRSGAAEVWTAVVARTVRH